MELTLPALLLTKAMEKENMLERAERNASLEQYNTMRVQSATSYLLHAYTKEELISALGDAKEKNIPILILGGGSNIIPPLFYNGLVIILRMEELKLERKEKEVVVLAQAGVQLPKLSYKITELGGSGIEWAAGVPGTVGGAIWGNAGAFGDTVADFTKEVEALQITDLKQRTFHRKECGFREKGSIFKDRKDIVILQVKMIFPLGDGSEKEKLEKSLHYRKENHPMEFPSAGSIFKNPPVEENFFLKHKEAEKFKGKGFVPAGFLIEQVGLSGTQRNGAEISSKHANFIINKGGAKAEDIKDLIALAKEKVGEKYGIKLEEEVFFP